MLRNTRSRTRLQKVADDRFRKNLTSSIHCLPNEVISHIFVIGCPTPNHERRVVDKKPLHHQLRLGSVCGLWRKIAHKCPALWTSVTITFPSSSSENELGFFEEIICSILRRSGTLELDLSIRLRGTWFAHPYYFHVIPHLPRVHTLGVECQYNASTIPLLGPFSNVPKLSKLRHLYAKGSPDFLDKWIFPFCTQNSPLETFHCQDPPLKKHNIVHQSPLLFSAIPTLRLRNVSLSLIHIERSAVNFVNKCDLRMLKLSGLSWDDEDHDDVVISSSTLTHLDLHAWCIWELPPRLLGSLPNLLHLRLEIEMIELQSDPPLWPPLPSLRSLSVEIEKVQRTCEPFVADLVHVAPQLVALQIDELDAAEVVQFIRAHRGEMVDGIERKPLKLLVLMSSDEFFDRRTKWGDLSMIAPILHGWDPKNQTGWHLKQCRHPIVIHGVEIRREGYGLVTPFYTVADQIIG